MWVKAKQDPKFRQWLLNYISCTVYECMPKEVIDKEDTVHVFQPLLHHNNPEFDDIMQLDVYDIVRSRQMHGRHYMPTCFKYGSKQCRFRFPCATVSETSFDETTGIIQVKRDDP